jgi:hypothetical protein
MKINIHSITDLITNSSTVIYTYSSSSEEAMKKMIDEVFHVLGVDKKCDDVFTLTVTSDIEQYCDHILDMEEEDLPDTFKGLERGGLADKVEEIVNKVTKGELKKPEWMKDIEEDEGHDDYSPSTTLNIIAKLPEYEKLAGLIGSFLYSTDHEASYG